MKIPKLKLKGVLEDQYFPHDYIRTRFISYNNTIKGPLLHYCDKNGEIFYFLRAISYNPGKLYLVDQHSNIFMMPYEPPYTLNYIENFLVNVYDISEYDCDENVNFGMIIKVNKIKKYIPPIVW